MTRRLLKYVLIAGLTALVLYNSVYFKKLSLVKATTSARFDAAAFSNKIWKEQLPARLSKAVALDELQVALQTDAGKAMKQYTNALAIGNIRFAMVQGAGRVSAVKEDAVTMQVPGSAPMTVQLETEFVYGNAIRDASGLVDVKDFVNTTDLNDISEALNKQVREQVLPGFKKAVKQRDSVWFVGAIELNAAHLRMQDPTIIPVQVKIIP